MTNPPVKFNGPEPIVNQFPHAIPVECTPGYPPNLKGIKTIPPPSPPIEEEKIDLNEDPIEEDDSLHDFKEEVSLAKALTELNGDKQVILAKLDQILDRKFVAIYRRLDRLEKEHTKAMSLLREGCPAQDAFWGFDNYRPLKHYGAIAGMSDRSYAMIFDAIDFNDGKLRDNRVKRKRTNL